MKRLIKKTFKISLVMSLCHKIYIKSKDVKVTLHASAVYSGFYYHVRANDCILSCTHNLAICDKYRYIKSKKTKCYHPN